MTDILTLYKGRNNGLINATLYTKDPDGALTAFNLTSGTITVEIYEAVKKKLVASFPGTIVNAANGIFTAIPDADDVNALSVTKEYYYTVKVVNASYPQGLVFGEDEDNAYHKCVVFGGS